MEKLEAKAGTLEEGLRPLLAPKLLAEAKAAQVVWARVKGYPAWPAQILTEAAAMRRPDLGQAAHSKEQRLPVMFFGTVEVAWMKDADIVDFKEGMLQGFFDRKTKPFKLALEQVCEFLALDRKRKAPPKWWCKPPANGLEEQSEASGSKPPSAIGGAAKGQAQRQEAAKASRQRAASPSTSESESSSSSEDEQAPVPRDVGKKAAGKPEGKGLAPAAAKAKQPAVPSAKPRDTSAPRLGRDGGSAGAPSKAASQSQPKRPASAPPSRPQPSASATAGAKEGRPAATGPAQSGSKPMTAAATKQPERPKATGGAPPEAAKGKDVAVPPRKRLKVEPASTSAPRPSASAPKARQEAPAPGPVAGSVVGASTGAEVAGPGSGDVDVLKLPAEIRRLAGIRLPALPKKPSLKVEESPREQPGVASTKAAPATAAAKTAAAPTGDVKREEAGVDARSKASTGGGKGVGKVDPAAANRGKRSRRNSSPSESDEDESASSSDSSDSDGESQSSGDDADTEESSESEAESSSEADSDEGEESSEQHEAATAARSGSKTAQARNRAAQAQPRSQTQEQAPKRDRQGEKQRRLARLAMPEPADRRTSSRLVAKPAEKTPSAQATVPKSGSFGRGKKAEGDTSQASSSGSESGQHTSSRNGKAGSASRAASDTEGEGQKARTSKRVPDAPRAKSEPPEPKPAARKAPVGLPPPGPSRPTSRQSEPMPNFAPGSAAVGGGGGGGEKVDEKQPAQAKRAESSGGASASGAAAAKAIPLELRRLQNESSGGPPAVDTAEPRTLRDRSSAASRAATPTQSVATAAGGAKCADKRSSDDGNGASTLPVAEDDKAGDRTRSPVDRQEGRKASLPERAHDLDGGVSKAGSAAGSPSPPPAPVASGMPVRKKPTTLGHASVRQVPAVLPAREALRNLASKHEAQPAAVPPTSGSAGTSAAGALAPAPMCVAKKPSAGPPTRHVVERSGHACVSSTDLPEASPAEGEANAKPGPLAASDGRVVPHAACEAGQTVTGDSEMEAQEAEPAGDAAAKLRPHIHGAVPPAQPKDEPMAEQEQEGVVVDALRKEQAHATAMDVDPRPAPQPGPGPLPEEAQRLQGSITSGAVAASCHADATQQELCPPRAAEVQPASTSEPPAAQAQESCPPSSSPTHPLPSPERQPASGEQEAQQRPRSAQASPLHEGSLLAEEQLPPDQPDEQDASLRRPRDALGASAATAAQEAAVEPTTCERLTSDESLSDGEADQQQQGALTTEAGAAARHSGAGDESSAGDGSGGRARGAGATCAGVLPTDAAVSDERDEACARELEELGEVAAALAGLQQAEPPRPPAAHADGGAPSAMGHSEGYADRARSRAHRGSSGRDRGGSSREASAYRWPQPEPLLPSQDQPFSLPRDWLLSRPPRYEPIRRNVYHSRVKPKRLPKDEVSICACRPPAPGEQRMGCGANCLNRLSSILCDPKLCPCGDLCSNRSLHLLRLPKTEVYLTENRGWGVRAVEPVPKGGFIIEYAGEVIDERELGRRMDHARMNGEPHFYIMELSAGMYVDARRKGNTARLINSSCDPNCETQKWHDASTGEVRVGIFAVRDIAPGEELVYDYFFSTYGAVKQSAASFVCMCGAKNCRGTMDLHPEKRRDLGRRVEVFWDADGQYYRAVVVAYHPTSRKHTIMYEDGGTEKLCLDEVPHRWMDESPVKRDSQRGDGGLSPTAHRQRPAQPEPQAARGDADGEGARGSSALAHAALRVGAEQPGSLPASGAATTGDAASTQGSLGKHGLQDHELHLPLKKRQKMLQAPHPSVPSSGGGGGEAYGGASHPQGSANGAELARVSLPGGAADSAGRELSGAVSGDASAAVTAADEETAEDLSSLLEAAEAVAALRTAPIVSPPPGMAQQDSGLPLQPRHIRMGNTVVGTSSGGGAVAMVQATKVASPRRLITTNRAGPPNGLPPHGGSGGGGFGRPAAHPSSSSGSLAGHRQTRPGQQSQDTSPVGHVEHPQLPAKSGRRISEKGNGSGYGYGNGINGINREDLLWRLVGIEKPKHLLPLFAGEDSEHRDGNGRNGSGGGWSSHPYGKLLRALEASELLPHAEQLRQQYQQVQQAQQAQQAQQQASQPVAAAVQQQQASLATVAATAAPQQAAQQAQQLPAAAAGASATAAQLAAWQAAQAQALQAQYPAAAYMSPASMAALIHAQQQHAAAAAAAATAAAAAAASGGQAHQPQHHTAATAAAAAGTTAATTAAQQQAHSASAAGAAAPAQHLAAAAAAQQQQLAAVAAQWQHMAHAAHQGHIFQDLVSMYAAAQHAAPHQMLAMTGAAAPVAGVTAAPVR